jgi:2,4-dienoyl-CoA reductase (NADPH2)
MELVQAGHEDKVKNKLILSQRSDELAIPEKLWHAIQKTPGWFPT